MAAADRSPGILELRWFALRNGSDDQGRRTLDFLRQAYMPAIGRAGGRVHGVFQNLVAPDGPSVLAVTGFDSLGAMDGALGKLAADKGYNKEIEALDAKGGRTYERMQTALLRLFPSMPLFENPPAPAGSPGRVFELRTYASNSPATLRRKIGMFESGGEIAIFRRLGITPVFFGEAIAGENLPNLTYLVVYDSLAAREKAWTAFVADAAWQELRKRKGLSDAEIVSNISNVLLRPAQFSPIQ